MMTDGERMVWAAEFVRSYAASTDPTLAAWTAHAVVLAMRFGTTSTLNDDAKAMLGEMLGEKR